MKFIVQMRRCADRFFELRLDTDGVEIVWVRNMVLDGTGPEIVLVVLVQAPDCFPHLCEASLALPLGKSPKIVGKIFK